MTTTFTRRPQRGNPEGGVRGGLDFRCDQGRTSVTIWVPGQLMSGSYSQIEYRLDERSPATARGWRASTDYSAVGLWESRPAIAFARSLFNAKRFAVRIHDNVFGTTEAILDIEHLSHRIQNVRQACRW